MTITDNLIQYVTRDTSFWPSGYGPPPDTTCTNANGCHMDGIHIRGLDGGTIARNRLYGVECQGIFIEPTNNSLNKDIDIVGTRSPRSSAPARTRRSTSTRNALNTTAGTWHIAFNSSPGLLDLDGFSGDMPGTTFDLAGNDMHLYLSDANGQRDGVPDGAEREHDDRLLLQRLDEQPSVRRARRRKRVLARGGRPAGAPSLGLDMHLSGPTGIGDNMVVCSAIPGGCGSSDIDGYLFAAVADVGADQR